MLTRARPRPGASQLFPCANKWLARSRWRVARRPQPEKWCFLPTHARERAFLSHRYGQWEQGRAPVDTGSSSRPSTFPCK